MQAEKFIDIEKLIKSKNPKVLKWMPRFVLRYLKRILHQDEVNSFLVEHKDKKNAEWCQASVDYLNITYSVENIENIPKEGKIVLVMNHPLGGMDAMILVSALQNHRKDLKFIVNDILLNIESMKDMFVGVNKQRNAKNKNETRESIKELFASDNAVCVFPAGLVSRKINGEVMDLEWKKTFVTLSRENDRTIIPIYIDGKLSNFFYRLHKLRTFLGIKANIEMLYLSNELFKQRNKHFKFIVGTPIKSDYLDQDLNDASTAQKIKKEVYHLRKQV
ncbi:MAG: 1-acyl-sn-glycerol-3-phosphate acyltransferase [Crocinitomicaceae bacterium]